MWLELGDNVLVDLDCFSYFSLVSDEIYAMQQDGNLWKIYDGGGAPEQFEKIRTALMEKQRYWEQYMEKVSK